jgi:ParB-like nuclease domain
LTVSAVVIDGEGTAAHHVEYVGEMRAGEVARWLTGSERLRRRRFELLATVGLGAVFSEAQGREPGESTTPANLVELISSIATVGVLQPILVEELDEDGGGRALRLVAGERRLRAVLWGARNLPANPHFGAIPAVICPGPLSEAERRTWQLVENLAREDLSPGELAAALLFERSGLLAAKLVAAGVALPAGAADLDDPAQRFRALDRIRIAAGCHTMGAPWPEVLRRLGIQMREDKARALVRAFTAMPAELSTEMDEAKVALATRLEYLQLARGRAEAAAELWAAVKRDGRPDLLHAAVHQAMDHPGLDAEAALARAGHMREAACEARAQQFSRTFGAVDAGLVVADVVGDALRGLRSLLGQLRAGRGLSRYDRGSLRLLAGQLAEILDDTSEGKP